MRALLDTSAYSALMRGHPDVRTAVQRPEQMYVNPVVLGELRAGFLRGSRTKKNEDELQSFLGSPRVTVVDIDEETAETYAVILDALRSAGTPVPTNDLWIAASAMQHGLRILTTDAHFLKIKQIIVECYEAT
jgi:tRNA(fMet)-specific endonuclease VapC